MKKNVNLTQVDGVLHLVCAVYLRIQFTTVLLYFLKFLLSSIFI